MSQRPPPDPRRRFAAREGLLVEQIEDEVLILDLERDVCFSLNPLGLIIWQALSTGASFGELIERLVEGFDAPRETLIADAAGFIDALERAALLSREPRL